MYIFFHFIQNIKGEKMNNEYFNQRISCLVKSCRFFDQKEQRCSLGCIEVGKSSNHARCNNYEKRNLE